MIPVIENALSGVIQYKTQPSLTYRLSDGCISGDLDGIDALRQTVFHILSTERYAYHIYDENYGVELQKYLGQGFSFLEATIEHTLREALLQDERISGVLINRIERVDKDCALVEFAVSGVQGLLNMEVVINV